MCQGTCLSFLNSSANIAHIDFYDNLGFLGGAILLSYSSTANISFNNFTNNSAIGVEQGGGAVFIHLSSTAIVSSTVFIQNTGD